MIIRFDGKPIVWPAQTHGDPESRQVKAGKLKPWRAAAECIDWSLPCPSVFDTKAQIMEKHGLRAQRPLAHNTLARVARGLHRYVLEAERPFLVNLTHGGRCEDVAAPVRTITGAHRGEKAAVAPVLVRHFAGSTGQSIERPAPTTPAGGGGKSGLLAPCLASIAHGYSGGRREYPLTDPMGTTTAGGIAHAVIAPSIARFNSGATGHAITDPMATVTSNSYIKRPGGAAPLGLLAPSLMSLKGTSRRDSAATTPHPTVLAGGGHSAILAPVLTYAQQGGRCRDIEAPHHTICASKKDQNAVIAASLIQTGYGERAGQAPRSLDIGRPLGTIIAGGLKHVPIAAFLAQQNGGPRMDGHSGHDPRAPLSTVTGSGSQQTPVSAFFAKYYGTGDGARADAPLHTITVKDRMGHIEAQLDVPPFTEAHADRARKVAELMRTHGLWDDREFVTVEIDGATFVIVDVGMRMLTPRELFNAQGFPADYVIDGTWTEHDGEWTFTSFPKDVQVSCVGNSVCPPVAEALARSNCGHLAVSAAQEAAA
ncbi:DNA cytosine methyltransferase [Pseudooceanicola sp. 502str34]